MHLYDSSKKMMHSGMDDIAFPTLSSLYAAVISSSFNGKGEKDSGGVQKSSTRTDPEAPYQKTSDNQKFQTAFHPTDCTLKSVMIVTKRGRET